MADEHTTTPWTVVAVNPCATKASRRWLIEPDIGVCKTKANATFIVRAANSHDALLAACKGALEYMGDDNGECALCGGGRSGLPYHHHCSCKPLRAAIALAEGAEGINA